MKKLFAIVILSFLFLPMWGSYFYFKSEQYVIRKKVKHKLMKVIPKEELVFMAFSQEDLTTKLNWKHSKEFELNGEWYDIVERVETADSAFYWLWWDKEETALNQKVRRIAAEIFGGSPDQNEKNQVIQQFYKSLFFEIEEYVSLPMRIHSSSSHFYYERFFKRLFYPAEGPPPKSTI